VSKEHTPLLLGSRLFDSVEQTLLGRAGSPSDSRLCRVSDGLAEGLSSRGARQPSMPASGQAGVGLGCAFGARGVCFSPRANELVL